MECDSEQISGLKNKRNISNENISNMYKKNKSNEHLEYNSDEECSEDELPSNNNRMLQNASMIIEEEKTKRQNSMIESMIKLAEIKQQTQ